MIIIITTNLIDLKQQINLKNMSDKERIIVSFNLNLLHNRYWGSDKKELG